MPWNLGFLGEESPPNNSKSFSDFEFSGVLGGANSQLGFLQSAFDPADYIAVKWIANTSLALDTDKIFFDTDEGGHLVTLDRGHVRAITRDQVRQAIAGGAILLEADELIVEHHSLVLHDVVLISDFGTGTVSRTNLESWSISDSVHRTSFVLAGRTSRDSITSAEFATPGGLRFRQANDSFAISDSTGNTFVGSVFSQSGTYRSQAGTIMQPGVP